MNTKYFIPIMLLVIYEYLLIGLTIGQYNGFYHVSILKTINVALIFGIMIISVLIINRIFEIKRKKRK